MAKGANKKMPPPLILPSFPPFNNNWENEVKIAWFDAYTHLYETARRRKIIGNIKGESK